MTQACWGQVYVCLLAGQPANEAHQNLRGRGQGGAFLPTSPWSLAPGSRVLFEALPWAVCPQALPFPRGADSSFCPYQARTWPFVSSSGAVMPPHRLGSLSALGPPAAPSLPSTSAFLINATFSKTKAASSQADCWEEAMLPRRGSGQLLGGGALPFLQDS